MPKLKDFTDFLTEKCRILESMTLNHKSNSNSSANKANSKPNNQISRLPNSNFNQKPSGQVLTTTTTAITCPCCQGPHRLYSCENFNKLSVRDRAEFAKSKRLCFNCLSSGHKNTDCRGKNCRKCSLKHNTLLHIESKNNALTAVNTSNQSNNNNQSFPLELPSQNNEQAPSVSLNQVAAKSQNLQVCMSTQVLLATAVVDFLDKNGCKQQARVLDGGAMDNFMTQSFADSLGLKLSYINATASGLNKLETQIKHSIEAKLFSKSEQFDAELNFLVVPSVCDMVPVNFLNKAQLEIPSHIQLADPKINVPAEIDVLIGAEFYYDWLNSGQIKLNHHKAKFLSTRLGWIIAGKFYGVPKSKKTHCLTSLSKIHNQIKRFWKIEEFPETKFLSEEDTHVENHFKNTTTHDNQGQYIVKLPFNKSKDRLGETFKIAEKRLYSLEKRFSRNPDLKTEYIKVMREYLNEGHIVEVREEELKNKKTIFLPHQAVIKQSSLTTKVRVVIDASAPSSTGYSLNNALYKGPNLTPDIFSTLIHLRVPTFAFVVDVKKMYLGVRVSEEDSFYQLILWRENENEEIKVYRIIKVIFGEAPAAYLAIRTIFQLADDEEEKYPIASKIVKKRFYVDNVAIGANSLEETILARDQLIALLADGGFILRQWASNDPRVINSLPEELKTGNDSKILQTLGINWDTETDEIVFNLSNELPNDEDVTKRMLFSDLMTLIHDAQGLTGTLKVKFKILMQKIWCLDIGWDERVPRSILFEYKQHKKEMNQVKELRFPRKCIIEGCEKLKIHGFGDACEQAYGACIYIRSCNKNGEIMYRLVCSKSRVAPLKQISLARLELCAALLLANLFKVTLDALNLNFDEIVLWSDSSIVLQWINTQPYKLKTFVANRISEIRNLTNPSWWQHVPSKLNPADLVSRGQLPLELINNRLWTEGPELLLHPKAEWPENKFAFVPVPDDEIKKQIALPQETRRNRDNFLYKFSSFDKLIRVTAYALRFLHNAQKQNQKFHGPLSYFEFFQARNKIILLVQREVFENDISSLVKDKTVKKSSILKSLNPYIDSNGYIRVGGRLKYAATLHEKNAIILPKHHVTEIIIRETHLRHFHSGVNATLNAMRYKYWPIHGRRQVKSVLSKCVTCCRAKPRENNFVMGNLPSARVSPSQPFTHTGVDYCGPFLIKEKKYRNKNSIKVYVSIFVCFATKACHIEVVHDLTSEGFIAALERFFARRGACTDLYSDNGTNFVGANNEIQALNKILMSENHNELVKNYLAPKSIQWHFTPPRSPHMGGLWEAAVKSFKRHLLRSVSPLLFTFEEFMTLTTKIEAILNSRPITPLSTDPNDFRALTPGHFLIGRPLTSTPEPSPLDLKQNKLSTWQHVQYLKQQFWVRWQREYLHELNSRSKWQDKCSDNVKIGTMVTLQEENVPPLHWILGRIIEIHPGGDGVVRVLTVRTKSGVYKRNVKKLSILPVE